MRLSPRPVGRLGLPTALALVLAAGCADAAGTGTPPPVPTAAPAPTVASPARAAGTVPAGGAARPATTGTIRPGTVATSRVTYGWAVPSSPVRVPHTVHPPVAPPPAPPLPYLTRISAENHPGGNPAYARISFTFAGAFPEYTLQYVPRVLSEGRGDPIPLTGNGFLRIEFVQATTHDGNGDSTVTGAPPAHLGYGNLISYGAAGDFEGHVGYGLGIGVASGSDQVLPIRVTEVTKPDGAGGTAHVVEFDVRGA